MGASLSQEQCKTECIESGLGVAVHLQPRMIIVPLGGSLIDADRFVGRHQHGTLFSQHCQLSDSSMFEPDTSTMTWSETTPGSGRAKPLLQQHGLQLGGKAFPGAPDKSRYRMFWRP